MFSVLDRYIGKTILGSILMTLFMLVSLSGIIKFVDQLRKVGKGDYDALSAGIYVLLSVPKDLEIFFPMAALLGALLALGGLATRSELVAMESSGYTRLQIAFSVMKTAIPLVLLTMAIGEWVAPIGEQTAREMRAQKQLGNSLVATSAGLWVKEGNDFVYIKRIVSKEEVSGINIYQFNNDRSLKSIINGKTATYDTDLQRWTLHQIQEIELESNTQVNSKNLISLDWNTSLTPDKLGIVALNPNALSISGLYNYISYLKASGQESGRYELAFWSKVLSPVSVAVMMLMALSFVFGPLRSVPMGVRVVTGISFGFLFYVLNEIFGNLSVFYEIAPGVGAVLPSALFLMLSIYLLQRKA